MVGINGRGHHGSARLQDGLKEHLFCHACEQFFSAKYERPYEQFWRKNDPLPNPWRGIEVKVKFDYGPFKLFHLLNLYRAAVSSLSSYRHVELGPHVGKLRGMLRSENPGEAHLYQISGSVILDQSGQLARLVTVPQKRRYETRIAWETCYGGVAWIIAISGGFPPATTKAALQADGSMRLMALPMHHYSVMHVAAALLNR